MSAIDSSRKFTNASIANSPRHVAIIMDGNNRWAKQRKLPSIAGHRAGLRAARNVVEACRSYNIEVLTLFAFSSENWRRPKDEVSALMELFLRALRRETKRLKKNKIRLKVIGDISAFSPTIQQHIAETEQATAEFSEFTLVIAANYGGQWDMMEACKQLSTQVQQGELAVDAITPEQIEANLSTAGLPLPDLCIRTSGVHRISNFLLWQLAYAELYFTNTLWPDFNKAAFHQALEDYSVRQRRFGQTSEQVEATQCSDNE